MSNDLVTFLLARISEDEAVAERAEVQHLQVQERTGWDSKRDVRVVGDLGNGARFEMNSYGTPDLLHHLARHDPCRILAECAAKRAIVGQARGPWTYTQDVGAGRVRTVTVPGSVNDERTLRTLAAVYADHPDYREEWRA